MTQIMSPTVPHETPSDTQRSKPTTSRTRRSTVLWPLGTVIVALLVWQAVSASGVANPIIFPAPTAVGVAIIDMLGQGYFWAATWSTLQVTFLGFLLGVGGAWVLGTMIAMFRTLRLSLYPLAIAFQNMPRIALAPLFLTWFGFGIEGKFVLSATLCFFPVLLSVIVGTDEVDESARRLLRSYGASRWQQYFRLTLPSSLPIVFAGIKTAITLALIGAIVAEFVGGSDGMGVLIKDFNFQLEIAAGFAVILLLAVIGLLLYGATEILERKLVTWREH